MSEGPRLVFLPGLGADHRLFSAQLDAFDHAACPAWPRHEPSDTLVSYASKHADTLLGDDRPILVGFSFGGMVALEIAATAGPSRSPRAIILLSGIRSRFGVSTGFRVQQRLGSLVPRPITRRLISGPLATRFGQRDGLNAEQTGILRAMAAETDLDFLFWGARACARWTRTELPSVPIFHAHGRRDRVIPYVDRPGLPGDRTLLLDAGHLITMTQPKAVNTFIHDTIRTIGD